MINKHWFSNLRIRNDRRIYYKFSVLSDCLSLAFNAWPTTVGPKDMVLIVRVFEVLKNYEQCGSCSIYVYQLQFLYGVHFDKWYKTEFDKLYEVKCKTCKDYF